MLYQERVSTSSNLQRVATVVAHELAHQWFGNLVTPSWWSDLWLNEGFASYVEYIGMNAVSSQNEYIFFIYFVVTKDFVMIFQVEPTWKVLEQFVVNDLHSVFGLDALQSSHPISIEVEHPDEISEIFDRISYEKGARRLKYIVRKFQK